LAVIIDEIIAEAGSPAPVTDVRDPPSLPVNTPVTIDQLRTELQRDAMRIARLWVD
jgi:hypothetical protein